MCRGAQRPLAEQHGPAGAARGSFPRGARVNVGEAHVRMCMCVCAHVGHVFIKLPLFSLLFTSSALLPIILNSSIVM